MTGILLAATALLLSVPATAWAASGAPGTDLAASATGTSTILTAAGVLVSAIAGATVAILAGIERIKRSRDRDQRRNDAELALQRRQIQWLHRREHQLTVSMARQGLPVPPPDEPYPTSPAPARDDTAIEDVKESA